MKERLPDFVIIDDDRINNMLCIAIIKNIIPGANVVGFVFPEEGLEYLNLKCAAADANEIILLLDINMPVLNGWDVLQKLETASITVRQHLKIFMLSSSLDPRDKEKAQNSSLTSGFIEKPLSLLNVRELFTNTIEKSITKLQR